MQVAFADRENVGDDRGQTETGGVASGPAMRRGIFLNNREAILEMRGRFSEDLAVLQRSIRWGEGDKLQELFTRTRTIRKGIIDAKQA